VPGQKNCCDALNALTKRSIHNAGQEKLGRLEEALRERSVHFPLTRRRREKYSTVDMLLDVVKIPAFARLRIS
jgi:hypothetical protein